MPAPLRIAIAVVLVPVVAVVALTVAWAVDTRGDDDVVGRNVEVAGVDLEGMTGPQVAAVAQRLSQELAAKEVVISTGDALLNTTAASLGASLDDEGLVDEALSARGGGSALTRPFRWAVSFVDPVRLDTAVVVDEPVATAEVERLNDQLPAPVEPVLVVDDGRAQVAPGRDGQAVDPADVVERLPATLAAQPLYVVSVEPVPVPPSIDPVALQAVADDANFRTDRAIEVVVEDQRTTVEPAQLRAWLQVSNDPPAWALDPAAAVAELRPRFSRLGPPEQQARFDVVDGTPVIVPSTGTVVCCAPDSAQRIAEALRAGAAEVALDTTIDTTDDGTAELAALAIVEEVSSFTTNHSCCENRVRNIQRFADLIRGSIIRPGERFSLNEAVGRRTEDRGFLPAGAIADGVLEPQVGGGVSQFATTFFNAAFFAGLDFIEYQSHSLYFSRYPRGREATISWPKPDLVVENNTPYGILVWPTYTGTSITVTLYSTRHLEVADVGRTETAQDRCTRVTTTRQRTYPDGHTETDSVHAVYRPAEGLDCQGNRTAAASG